MNKEVTIEEVKQKCKELSELVAWFNNNLDVFSLQSCEYTHNGSIELHTNKSIESIAGEFKEVNIHENTGNIQFSKNINGCNLYYIRKLTLEDIQEKLAKEKAIAGTMANQQNVDKKSI